MKQIINPADPPASFKVLVDLETVNFLLCFGPENMFIATGKSILSY